MSAFSLGPSKAVTKTAYDERNVGLMDCVKSSADKVMELCKEGWNLGSVLLCSKGRACEVAQECPMRFCEESEKALGSDGGLGGVKYSMGSNLDEMGTNSVSEVGQGTGMGDTSKCISAAESVFNKLRAVPAAEFTGACTYVGGLIPVHESRRRRLATTFDPLSQVNLIAEQYVDSDWTWLEGAEVNGVGGKAKALGSVIVPQWSLTMGGWKRDIEAVVFEKLPQNMQLLIGLPVIRHGDDRLICDQWRVHSLMSKEVLRTDVLAMVLARLAGPAESHLVLCGGLCPHLVEMLALGCNIDKVFSVESDLSVRTTAEALWEFLVHVEPHRVEDVDWENFNFSAISSAVASPPCQPWSTRSGRAAGFEDPRSEAFVACARVLTLAKEKNADVKRLLENVMVDPKLVNDAERQESLVGG